MGNLASEQRELTASDGKSISAYHVKPSGRVRGGLVVVQEIFGVNAHIRRVADNFAQHGYEVLAPALFDRVERGVELDYDDASRKRGMAVRGELGLDAPLLDIQAAIEQLSTSGKVSVVGYCFGGTLAYLSATRLNGLSAAVGYYGSAIPKFIGEVPRVPVLLHCGEQDGSFPLEEVERVRTTRPDVKVELYPAQHGFNCDVRSSYHAASAKLALERTLAFLEQNA